jgi:hypothetical protein
MTDSILKFCINSRTIYSMPAAVNSPSACLQDENLPLCGTGIETVSTTTPSTLSSAVSLGLSAPL